MSSASPPNSDIARRGRHFAFVPIVLQKSKVASVRIFGEALKRKAIDDSYNLSRAIFDTFCKTTFATLSAMNGSRRFVRSPRRCDGFPREAIASPRVLFSVSFPLCALRSRPTSMSATSGCRMKRRDVTTKPTRIRRGSITEVQVRWAQNDTLGNIEKSSDVFAMNRSIVSLRRRVKRR
jgi:hypothetical protein